MKGTLGTLGRLEAGFLLFFLGHSGYFPVLAAECASGRWSDGPRAVSGHFEGTFEVSCTSSVMQGPPLLQQDSPLVPLFRKKAQEGAFWLSQDTLTPESLRFDLRRIPPSKPSLELTETVILSRDGRLYQSQSSKVQGTGLEGCVRQVRFEAMFSQENQGPLRFQSRSFLQVERPWYSPGPLFYPLIERRASTELQWEVELFAEALDQGLRSLRGDVP